MGVTTAGEGGSSRWEGERGGIGVPVDVGVIMGWPGGGWQCRPGRGAVESAV